MWAPLGDLGVCESGDVGCVELLVLNGGSPAQGAVASLPVVEDLQVLKDRVGQLDASPPPPAIQQLSLHPRPEDSITALSKASPIVRARRGMQVAVVATARKLATLCWHLVVGEQDYAFQRPSLTDKKLRALQLRAGMPPRRGQKGTAAAYSLKEVRRRERALTEQAEVAYRQLVAGWQAKRPATKPR
jgi:hypothetical protein